MRGRAIIARSALDAVSRNARARHARVEAASERGAAADDALVERLFPERVRARVPHAPQERRPLLGVHEGPRALLADALQDREHVLEVADVEHGQLEADDAEVARAPMGWNTGVSRKKVSSV